MASAVPNQAARTAGGLTARAAPTAGVEGHRTNPTSWGVEFENRDYNGDDSGDITGQAVALCGSP